MVNFDSLSGGSDYLFLNIFTKKFMLPSCQVSLDSSPFNRCIRQTLLLMNC